MELRLCFSPISATYTRQGTNFRPAEKFDWRLSSHKTVNILALFTRNFERLDVSRRLNFRTVKGRNLSW